MPAVVCVVTVMVLVSAWTQRKWEKCHFHPPSPPPTPTCTTTLVTQGDSPPCFACSFVRVRHDSSAYSFVRHGSSACSFVRARHDSSVLCVMTVVFCVS